MNKKNIDEKLSDALNIESPQIVEGEIIEYDDEETAIQEAHKNKEELQKDYESVRKNLRDIIERGKMAIDGILSVAEDTDSPRAYEVAAQMIKNVSEVNKDLIDIHAKLQGIENNYDGPKTVTTNNTLFIGSTNELQKFIKEQQKILLDEEEQESEDGDI